MSSWRCISGYAVQRDLEAAVQCEPVDVIAAHTATDTVTRLEDLHGHAGLVQSDGTRQPGQAGADDGDRLVGTLVTCRAALAAPWRDRGAGT